MASATHQEPSFDDRHGRAAEEFVLIQNGAAIDDDEFDGQEFYQQRKAAASAKKTARRKERERRLKEKATEILSRPDCPIDPNLAESVRRERAKVLAKTELQQQEEKAACFFRPKEPAPSVSGPSAYSVPPSFQTTAFDRNSVINFTSMRSRSSASADDNGLLPDRLYRLSINLSKADPEDKRLRAVSTILHHLMFQIFTARDREAYLDTLAQQLVPILEAHKSKGGQVSISDSIKTFCKTLLESGEYDKVSRAEFGMFNVAFTNRLVHLLGTGEPFPITGESDLSQLSWEADPAFQDDLLLCRLGLRNSKRSAFFFGARMNRILTQFFLLSPHDFDVFACDPVDLFLHLFFCWVLGDRALLPDKVASMTAAFLRADRIFYDMPSAPPAITYASVGNAPFVMQYKFPLYVRHAPLPDTPPPRDERAFAIAFVRLQKGQVEGSVPLANYLESLQTLPEGSYRGWAAIVYGEPGREHVIVPRKGLSLSEKIKLRTHICCTGGPIYSALGLSIASDLIPTTAEDHLAITARFDAARDLHMRRSSQLKEILENERSAPPPEPRPRLTT